MTERETTGAQTGYPGPWPEPETAGPAGPAPWRGRLALLAGSTTALVMASLVGSALGFANKAACRGGDWNVYLKQFQAHCYTDIYPLYFGEGLSAGKVPYTGHPVEYPVLIGGAMQLVAWLVRPITDPYVRGREFFDVTVLLLVLFSLAGTLATAYLAGRSRRWTALLVALAPALILAAFINWDLVAMGLVALAMAAWAARRQVLAGVLLGLAVATKFYPLVFFGPLLLLCLRAGRMRAFAVTTASAAAAWLAVNLPVALAAPTGWLRFYKLSETRVADWGSIWYFFETERWPFLSALRQGSLNAFSLAVFAAGCVIIGVIILAAPRRPRLPQVFFLVLAVFLLANKVWSPQYVIWLVPLVVLARPRLWAYAFWQLAEVGYFFAIWAYLITLFVSGPVPAADGGISAGVYFAALLARFGTVALLCVLVTTDILRPERDVVRADGEDDPAGGVLAGAPDRFVLRLRPRPAFRRLAGTT
ncbi:MAG TPA: glycosyltransferase 87 family protein [Streptosporangiaceae bacterium]|nr:glycosyltransferase 87 family protein [Streptosporangiaceae bacterium]